MTVRGAQISHRSTPLDSQRLLQRLLKRCLRKVLMGVVDRLACTPVKGQQCCPKAIQLLAQEDQLPDKSGQRFRVLVSEISNRLDVWSKFAKKPNELHVAMGFPLKSSARANPVQVSINAELEPIPWRIARSTSQCRLSPRESKPLQLKPLHLRIHTTNRMVCHDIVIEQIRHKEPLGPAVSHHVAHPASLRCLGGRLYWSVRGRKEFSHSLALHLTRPAMLVFWELIAHRAGRAGELCRSASTSRRSVYGQCEETPMWCSAIRGIVMLILSLLATPRTLDAQPVGQVRRIGFLAPGARALIATSSRFESFTHALRAINAAIVETL
jgi:hypothetical protein